MTERNLEKIAIKGMFFIFAFAILGCDSQIANFVGMRSRFSPDDRIAGPQLENPTPIVSNYKIVEKIVGGYSNCVFHDQGIDCWGSNSYAQLGVPNSTPNIYVPIQLSLASSIQSIAIGIYHTCILSDGGVKCVGGNSSGQLGNGTLVDSTSLVEAIPANSGVTAVVASLLTNCAIKSGGLFCWGWNPFGQIGDGTITTRSSPVQIFAMNSGVEKVALGERNSCAIVASELWCWGQNFAGQVGDGSLTQRLSPVKITALGTGVTDVSIGTYHTCAIKNDGVYCWGANTSGQLGDGTTVNKSVPTLVIAEGSDVDSISLGSDHSCALVAGALKCWGSNSAGQMNDLVVLASKLSPTTIFDSSFGITHFASGPSHICAVKNSRTPFCWGSGFLGNGDLGDSTTWVSPQQVLGLETNVEKLAKTELLWDDSQFQSCAIQNGGLKCWGSNTYGIIGDGTNTSSKIPVQTFAPGSGVTEVAVLSGSTNSSTCAVVNGGIQCWGNGYGLSPMQIVAPGSGATSISLTQYDSFGDDYACAIINGGVKCWGINSYGQLGNGSTVASPTNPVTAIAAGSNVTKIEISQGSSCAIVNGGLRCWGLNADGRLGDGTTTTRTSPVSIFPAMSSVTDIAIVGDWSFETEGTTCAVVAGGLKCWGNNSFGMVGDGTTTNRLSPVDIFPAASGVTKVWGRYKTICAIKNGGLYCWGKAFGTLGNGLTTDELAPSLVIAEGSGVTDFDIGLGHGCAVVSGGLKCWGINNQGSVGDGTVTPRLSPVTVYPENSNVDEVRVTYYGEVVCARVNGAMKCWGQDIYLGLIGNGKVSRGEFNVVGF